MKNINSIYRLLLIYCIVLLSISRESLAQEMATGLGVNDVSFLLPYSSGTIYPDIRLDESAGSLLTPNLLDQVLNFEGHTDYPNLSSLKNLNNWRVVAIRIDDCGDTLIFKNHQDVTPSNAPLIALGSSGCTPRIRIVTQPFSFLQQPLPSALHLLYRLDEAELMTAAQGLLKIKNLVGGNQQQPLGVHPGLQDDIKSSNPFLGAQLKSWLIQTLSLSNKTPLERLEILTLTLGVGTNHWKLIGGAVIENKWRRFITFFSESIVQTSNNTPLSQIGVEEIQCNFYQYCLSSPQDQKGNIDTIRLLSNLFRKDQNGNLMPPQKNELTEKIALNIDQPQKTNFFNTDCLSCHQSSNYRSKNLIPNDFSTPKGITPFVVANTLGNKPSSIINFGYEGLNPRVSTRVAAESAEVANRINLKMGWKNSGYNPKSLNDFWNCLMTPLTTDNSITECFTK